MRKRNVAILFRLNKKEAEALDKKVKRSGLNREAYLRQLISGVVPGYIWNRKEIQSGIGRPDP